MRAPIIVNESPTPLESGCIYLFRSVLLAERYFEAWYADESYFACDMDGLPILIVPNSDTGGVHLVEKEDLSRPDLADKFIRSYVEAMTSVKKIDDINVTKTWVHSAPIEEVAEVGLRHATE